MGETWDFIKDNLTVRTILITDELEAEYAEDVMRIWEESNECDLNTQVVFNLTGIYLPDCALISSDEELLQEARAKNMATIGVDIYGNGDVELTCDILSVGMSGIDLEFIDRIVKRNEGIPWNILITERTILREITLDDLDRLFEIYDAPGITDYMENLFDRDDEEEYIRKYIDNIYRFYGYGMWVVCDKDTHEIIGRAGFSHGSSDSDASLELGYVIAKEHQMQGIASEVIEALIDYARLNLFDFATLSCFIHPDNAISIHLAEKFNFEYVGTVTVKGVDSLHYQLEL